jgi:hypothetical protein
VADLEIGEVELPIGIGLGGVLGEVGVGAELGGLGALVLAPVGDVAADLALAGRSGGGHVGAAVERAVREPGDLPHLLLTGLRGHRLEEALRQGLTPAAVRQRLLGRLGREHRDRALGGWQGSAGP